MEAYMSGTAWSWALKRTTNITANYE